VLPPFGNCYALRVYEKEMIDYGFAAVRAGAINGQRHLGRDPLPA